MMQEEEDEDLDVGDDETEEPTDRSQKPRFQRPEPDYEDLEDKLARNEAQVFELSAAANRLRAVSTYWYLAGAVLLTAAIVMAIPTVTVTGSLAALVPQSIVGQTAWNSVTALTIVIGVACFIRFTSLRHLAREARDAAELNRHIVFSVRKRLERAG